LDGEASLRIASDRDLVPARARARELATALGFTRTDATLIATAISEVARNIIVHAGDGEISFETVREEHRYGLIATATDTGPGIRDLELVLAPGYSGRSGLGLGLAGARRLMDEFAIESNGNGTVVRMTKWRTRDELERLRERRKGER
jgi:anti-sigma regulatory factor (Ser/Thr protein kinase)